MARNAPSTLRLILGDQLNPGHSWLRGPDDDVIYAMMEMRQETDYVRHHIQKICAFFAAMRAFAEWLGSRGHRVTYLRIDDPRNRQELGSNIRALIEEHGIQRFEYQLPDEFRLDAQLRRLQDELPCVTQACDTEHFLSARHEVEDFFTGRKEFRMEPFYRHMRRRHDVLMDEGKPAGGRWNYDPENRAKFRGQVDVPPLRRQILDVTDIHEAVVASGVKSLGTIDPRRLAWPVTRRQALSALNHFLRYGLPHFGTYQDAMSTEHPFLFHSLLSFALNVKLLHPRTVIDRAVRTWKERPGEITLPQIEGFVRQILGWREYMRGIYWAHMPALRDLNSFGHDADLPHYYWDADTHMNCLKHAIGQSLEHAYAHHIQRLMVTGNFALLAGVHPDAVDAWYLGVYIDAIEWVELPNTRGMSQYADGGLTATKPYVSTANYIHGMSDYCAGCAYDHKRRHGDGACPFNSLHWDFYERHRTRLADNPRVATMYRVWDRMDAMERDRILHQARIYRERIEDL